VCYKLIATPVSAPSDPMANRRQWRMNLHLRLVRIAATSETLDHLHSPIEQEIAAASQRIEEATRKVEDEYRDAVIDDECARVEELLGLAFVAAQTFMTGVRSSIATLSKACESDFSHPLAFVSDPKAFCVFDTGEPLQAGSTHTTIRAINAITNYWKHQDDWPTREEIKNHRCVAVWDSANMRDNEKNTVEIVASIGMAPLSSGNLRTAVEMLGVTDYGDLSPVRQKLKDWANALYQAARQAVDQLELDG
jgi:hypothetical protein